MDYLAEDRLWILSGVALYCLAFAVGLISLIRSRRHSRVAMFAIVAIGFVVHTAGLYLRGLRVGGCPLGNGFEIAQFLVWSLTLLYLVVGPAFRMSLLGLFTSGLAATLGAASWATPGLDAVVRSSIFGGNPWIELHAALAVFSYGAFGMLALTSAMFLLQSYSLRRKRTGRFYAFLPSIVQLEQMNVRLLLLGLVILTVSLAVGSVYWIQEPESVNGAKLLMTVSLWAAYAVAYGLRQRQVLIADSLAWSCIVLFCAALISLAPVNASRHSVVETVSRHSHG
jgi:HemX protein